MINRFSFNPKDVKSFVLVKGNDLFLYKACQNEYKLILKTSAIHGKNGFTADKKEGDGKTPVGTYNLCFAFGLCHKPQTDMKYIKADGDCFLVDDPNSKYYNRFVSTKCVKKDWQSAEKISDYKKEYAYAVFIGYNTEQIKGKGSAILLHCKGEKSYTAGCIAVKREDMLFILSNINSTSKIVITSFLS